MGARPGLPVCATAAWDRAPGCGTALWATDAGLAYVVGVAATSYLMFGTPHAWCAQPVAWSCQPRWRRRCAVAAVLDGDHLLGRELLQYGLPDDARVEAGLPLPRLADAA